MGCITLAFVSVMLMAAFVAAQHMGGERLKSCDLVYVSGVAGKNNTLHLGLVSTDESVGALEFMLYYFNNNTEMMKGDAPFWLVNYNFKRIFGVNDTSDAIFVSKLDEKVKGKSPDESSQLNLDYYGLGPYDDIRRVHCRVDSRTLHSAMGGGKNYRLVNFNRTTRVLLIVFRLCSVTLFICIITAFLAAAYDPFIIAYVVSACYQQYLKWRKNAEKRAIERRLRQLGAKPFSWWEKVFGQRIGAVDDAVTVRYIRAWHEAYTRSSNSDADLLLELYTKIETLEKSLSVILSVQTFNSFTNLSLWQKRELATWCEKNCVGVLYLNFAEADMQKLTHGELVYLFFVFIHVEFQVFGDNNLSFSCMQSFLNLRDLPKSVGDSYEFLKQRSYDINSAVVVRGVKDKDDAKDFDPITITEYEMPTYGRNVFRHLIRKRDRKSTGKNSKFFVQSGGSADEMRKYKEQQQYIFDKFDEFLGRSRDDRGNGAQGSYQELFQQFMAGPDVNQERLERQFGTDATFRIIRTRKHGPQILVETESLLSEQLCDPSKMQFTQNVTSGLETRRSLVDVFNKHSTSKLRIENDEKTHAGSSVGVLMAGNKFVTNPAEQAAAMAAAPKNNKESWDKMAEAIEKRIIPQSQQVQVEAPKRSRSQPVRPHTQVDSAAGKPQFEKRGRKPAKQARLEMAVPGSNPVSIVSLGYATRGGEFHGNGVFVNIAGRTYFMTNVHAAEAYDQNTRFQVFNYLAKEVERSSKDGKPLPMKIAAKNLDILLIPIEQRLDCCVKFASSMPVPGDIVQLFCFHPVTKIPINGVGKVQKVNTDVNNLTVVAHSCSTDYGYCRGPFFNKNGDYLGGQKFANVPVGNGSFPGFELDLVFVNNGYSGITTLGLTGFDKIEASSGYALVQGPRKTLQIDHPTLELYDPFTAVYKEDSEPQTEDPMVYGADFDEAASAIDGMHELLEMWELASSVGEMMTSMRVFNDGSIVKDVAEQTVKIYELYSDVILSPGIRRNTFGDNPGWNYVMDDKIYQPAHEGLDHEERFYCGHWRLKPGLRNVKNELQEFRGVTLDKSFEKAVGPYFTLMADYDSNTAVNYYRSNSRGAHERMLHFVDCLELNSKAGWVAPEMSTKEYIIALGKQRFPASDDHFMVGRHVLAANATDYLFRLEEGDEVTAPYVVFGKMDKYSYKKIAAEKVRTIQACDVYTKLIWYWVRKESDDLWIAQAANPCMAEDPLSAARFMTGVNPNAPVDEMRKRIYLGSCFSASTDVTGWDRRMPRALIWYFFYVYIKLLCPGIPEGLLKFLFYNTACSTLWTPDGEELQKSDGNPSGFPNTLLLNCIVHAALIHMALHQNLSGYGGDRHDVNILGKVFYEVCGDDCRLWFKDVETGPEWTEERCEIFFRQYIAWWNKFLPWDLKEEGKQWFGHIQWNGLRGVRYTAAVEGRMNQIFRAPMFVGRRLISICMGGNAVMLSPLAESYRCLGTLHSEEKNLAEALREERLQGVEAALSINVLLHVWGYLYDTNIAAARIKWEGKFTLIRALKNFQCLVELD